MILRLIELNVQNATIPYYCLYDGCARTPTRYYIAEAMCYTHRVETNVFPQQGGCLAAGHCSSMNRFVRDESAE